MLCAWALLLPGCASGPAAPTPADTRLESAAADAAQAEAQAVATATARCGAPPLSYEWHPRSPPAALPAAAIARARLSGAAVEGDGGLGELIYRCRQE